MQQLSLVRNIPTKIPAEFARREWIEECVCGGGWVMELGGQEEQQTVMFLRQVVLSLFKLKTPVTG